MSPRAGERPSTQQRSEVLGEAPYRAEWKKKKNRSGKEEKQLCWTQKLEAQAWSQRLEKNSVHDHRREESKRQVGKGAKGMGESGSVTLMRKTG